MEICVHKEDSIPIEPDNTPPVKGRYAGKDTTPFVGLYVVVPTLTEVTVPLLLPPIVPRSTTPLESGNIGVPLLYLTDLT